MPTIETLVCGPLFPAKPNSLTGEGDLPTSKSHRGQESNYQTKSYVSSSGSMLSAGRLWIRRKVSLPSVQQRKESLLVSVRGGDVWIVLQHILPPNQLTPGSKDVVNLGMGILIDQTGENYFVEAFLSIKLLFRQSRCKRAARRESGGTQLFRNRWCRGSRRHFRFLLPAGGTQVDKHGATLGLECRPGRFQPTVQRIPAGHQT